MDKQSFQDKVWGILLVADRGVYMEATMKNRGTYFLLIFWGACLLLSCLIAIAWYMTTV